MREREEQARTAATGQANKKNRTNRVTIRLTGDEYAQFRSDSEIAGLTLAALGRKRLLGRRVASKADLAVLAELRRLGGLFKHSYTETGGIYSDRTAAAIDGISQYVRALTAKHHETSNSEGKQ